MIKFKEWFGIQLAKNPSRVVLTAKFEKRKNQIKKIIMKKIAIFLFLILMLQITGCEMKSNNEKSVTQDDSEVNLLLNTSESINNNINYQITKEGLSVSGYLIENDIKYVLLQYDGYDSKEVKSVPVENGDFTLISLFPDNATELTANLYGGLEEYGAFNSIIIDFVKLENNGDGWKFKTSPVLKSNKEQFDSGKDELNDYLQPTEYIQSDKTEIIQLSDEITMNAQNEYNKVRLIHDWVAENIYYDFEAFYSGNYRNSDSINVLHSKRAVCEGYANLFAALVRAQNIPCLVRSGYALGIGTDKEWTTSALNMKESNHAWNEVYVDGRWIIVDATWDSQNKIEDKKIIKGNSINHIYFDSSMEFFSLSHRIIEAEIE